ncbi:MAG TPA: amino acid ABC transporter permease [Burkholderiaceae bacterium]|nr:amino acid ABC transporter permease [Burkholderiaceae bacterium]
MGYNWDWSFFFEEDPNSGVLVWKLLLDGLLNTLTISVGAWVIAVFVGAVIGTIRTGNHRGLVALGNCYVELFRNIPLLVQMFLWFFVLPVFVAPLRSIDYSHYQLVSAVLCLGLFTAARIAEQVRSGIMSLPRGQRYAGMALGLTTVQTYRFVLLPMAFRIIIPPLTSETMNLIKNSTIALTIGYAELTFRGAKEIAEYNFRFFEMYVVLTAIYITVAMTANRIMAFIERKIAVPGFIAAGGGGGH